MAALVGLFLETAAPDPTKTATFDVRPSNSKSWRALERAEAHALRQGQGWQARHACSACLHRRYLTTRSRQVTGFSLWGVRGNRLVRPWPWRSQRPSPPHPTKFCRSGVQTQLAKPETSDPPSSAILPKTLAPRLAPHARKRTRHENERHCSGKGGKVPEKKKQESVWAEKLFKHSKSSKF